MVHTPDIECNIWHTMHSVYYQSIINVIYHKILVLLSLVLFVLDFLVFCLFGLFVFLFFFFPEEMAREKAIKTSRGQKDTGAMVRCYCKSTYKVDIMHYHTLFLSWISSVVNYPDCLSGCEVSSTAVKHAQILLNFMTSSMPLKV